MPATASELLATLAALIGCRRSVCRSAGSLRRRVLYLPGFAVRQTCGFPNNAIGSILPCAMVGPLREA